MLINIQCFLQDLRSLLVMQMVVERAVYIQLKRLCYSNALICQLGKSVCAEAV